MNTQPNDNNPSKTQPPLNRSVQSFSQKPRRASFMKTIVIGGDGNVVDEKTWREKVGQVEGRKLTSALKREHLQAVKIFLEDEYLKEKNAYYTAVRSGARAERELIIQTVCEDLNIPHIPRLENSLKVMLPLLRDESGPKIVSIFKNVVKALGAGPLQAEQTRLSSRQSRKTTVATGSNKRQSKSAGPKPTHH